LLPHAQVNFNSTNRQLSLLSNSRDVMSITGLHIELDQLKDDEVTHNSR
jgi:hypothetical protein